MVLLILPRVYCASGGLSQRSYFWLDILSAVFRATRLVPSRIGGSLDGSRSVLVIPLRVALFFLSFQYLRVCGIFLRFPRRAPPGRETGAYVTERELVCVVCVCMCVCVCVVTARRSAAQAPEDPRSSAPSGGGVVRLPLAQAQTFDFPRGWQKSDKTECVN